MVSEHVVSKFDYIKAFITTQYLLGVYCVSVVRSSQRKQLKHKYHHLIHECKRPYYTDLIYLIEILGD